MRILPRLIASLLAAGLAMAPVTASAAPGLANVNANVRSGPGLGYRVVDVLEAGEYVIVKDCGHLSTIEQPQAVNAAMAEWLAA